MRQKDVNKGAVGSHSLHFFIFILLLLLSSFTVFGTNTTTENHIYVENFIPENYLFLIIVAMLSFLAFYLKNWVLLIASGLLFLLLPFIYNFDLTGLSQASIVTMFILIGLSIIYQGIYSLSDERKPKQ